MTNEGCENIIKKTGWGLCHYVLIGLCALATLAEAVATLTVLIVTPLLACDLKFNKNDIMALNATSSLGMAIGSFIFGILSDYIGRKNLIPTTMVIIFCASIGLSFSQTYFFISSAIFILGIGAAGNNIIVRVYLIECLPAKKRGSYLALIDLIWITGCVSTLGLSWSLVPSIIRMLENEFRPSSWRVLAGLGGAPSLIMACATSLLPPSLRYLLYRRQLQQALVVLQQMFAINNSQHANNFPLCNLNNCVRGDNDDPTINHYLDLVREFFLKIWRRIIIICSPFFINNTLLFILSKLLLFPSFIWLLIWKIHSTHQLISNQELLSNQTCTTHVGDMVSNFLHNCHEVRNSSFKHSLIFLSSFILGELFLIFGIDIIGRRISILTSGIVGGSAIICLIFTTRYDVEMALSILFLAFYSVIYTSINISILENYPTSVRGSIMGLTTVLPHVTSFFIKMFSQITCLKSTYAVASLLISATIATMPIPDLTNSPMQE
ncbi:synaptic vesicle glycoprotein 2B-like [Chelonus insularis]|uniref:synaptic vesicle glycoprotein 2B-like n=1 Tax=Chelonus insularis TaxID=460826 RepID=UPI00158BD9D6|nr:synaptic vesicle glycoprotein 2B-like [Chelonus insularis]